MDLRDFTWQVWVALGVMALALIGGLASLFLPHEPTRVVPLLGYADHMPSSSRTAAPKPSPRRSPARAPSPAKTPARR